MMPVRLGSMKLFLYGLYFGGEGGAAYELSLLLFASRIRIPNIVPENSPRMYFFIHDLERFIKFVQDISVMYLYFHDLKRFIKFIQEISVMY